MIDPVNLTDYYRSYRDLEETALWSVLVAGKNALTTARALDRLLKRTDAVDQPFRGLKKYEFEELPEILKECGFGCFNSKAQSVFELVNSRLDLRTCSIEQLEEIHGIGKKTSRMFILHTRRDARCVALDRHILRWLSELGYKVPRATPASKKLYKKIEVLFIKLVPEEKTIAEFDLEIWRYYSGNSENKKPPLPRREHETCPENQ